MSMKMEMKNDCTCGDFTTNMNVKKAIKYSESLVARVFNYISTWSRNKHGRIKQSFYVF